MFPLTHGSNQHRGMSCPSSNPKAGAGFRHQTLQHLTCPFLGLLSCEVSTWILSLKKAHSIYVPTALYKSYPLNHQLLSGPYALNNNTGTHQKVFPQLPGSISAGDGHSKAAWSDGAIGLTRLYLPCWLCMGQQLGEPGVPGQGLPGAGSYEASTHQSWSSMPSWINSSCCSKLIG